MQRENAQGQGLEGSSERNKKTAGDLAQERVCSGASVWRHGSHRHQQRVASLSCRLQQTRLTTQTRAQGRRPWRHAGAKQGARYRGACPWEPWRAMRFSSKEVMGPSGEEGRRGTRTHKTGAYGGGRGAARVLLAAGPRTEQGQKGVPKRHTCPQGSEEARGHNANPK